MRRLAAATAALSLAACGTVEWTFDATSEDAPSDAGAADDGAEPARSSADAGGPRDGGASWATAAGDASWWESGPDAGCTTDEDCSSADMRCDTASGECVECLDDGDCGQGRACEYLECVASCAGGATCPAATPVCLSSRDVCVPCQTNEECANASTGQYCLASTGQCVECLDDDDCDTGYCSSASNSCVRR